MKIVITGPKACGKTTAGREAAAKLGLRFAETDSILEDLYASDKAQMLTFREIYKREGETFFRELEVKAVERAASQDWIVLSTGGGTMLNPASRSLLLENAILVLIKADASLLWDRIAKDGIPDFFKGDDGFEKMKDRNAKLYEILEPRADLVIEVREHGDIAEEIYEGIKNLIPLLMHSPSTLGEIIRVTTFGESHGPAVGAVLDGVKPGVAITLEEIQRELDRRRPGQSSVTTPRNETDEIKILSGVFEGKTTGAPICMVVFNKDQDSSKYEALKDIFRPGHADFTFYKKYGIRDHRGGGRSSGRETLSRVAAGAFAKKILRDRGVEIFAYASEIAGIRGEKTDLSFIEKNPVRAADPDKAPAMEKAVLEARKQHDSVGGIVELVVKNLPAGLGDPVFFKLDARLGMALFSIGAVKGIEFGAGFASAVMKGSENNDSMTEKGFAANNAGGILGGISTGCDLTARIGVKPTPSIFQEQQTVDINGEKRQIKIEGRHDPCIVPRIIPVIEAMAAIVLLDAYEINERLK